MEGAVLADDGAAVDAYNVAVGECLANDALGLGVEVGLVVGGDEHGTIDDQIVGIGGRKTITLNFVIDEVALTLVKEL